MSWRGCQSPWPDTEKQQQASQRNGLGRIERTCQKFPFPSFSLHFLHISTVAGSALSSRCRSPLTPLLRLLFQHEQQRGRQQRQHCGLCVYKSARHWGLGERVESGVWLPGTKWSCPLLRQRLPPNRPVCCPAALSLPAPPLLRTACGTLPAVPAACRCAPPSTCGRDRQCPSATTCRARWLPHSTAFSPTASHSPAASLPSLLRSDPAASLASCVSLALLPPCPAAHFPWQAGSQDSWASAAAKDRFCIMRAGTQEQCCGAVFSHSHLPPHSCRLSP